jgi:hypothetical protein
MKMKTAAARAPKARAVQASPAMTPYVIALFVSVLLCAAILWAMTNAANAAAPATGYVVDFTDYRAGSVDAWLRAKGFAFERDAKDNASIEYKADARGLEVSALRPAQGILINRMIDANAFSSVEIEWGVAQHPQGASYEKKVNNEAIMVQVFFGTEKKPSGSMFAPDIPYFVGLLLCNGDRIGHPYSGRYYQEGGRYVCVDAPAAGATVVSHFNLKQGARAAFGAAIAEAVSGYSIEVDTTGSAGEGKSSAFIKRIRFVT